MKADLVVAVEANPALCERIRSRFQPEIERGRVVVENCVAVANPNGPGKVDFYIHRTQDFLSQVGQPPDKDWPSFIRQSLRAYYLPDLIARHGEPYFVKLDCEHYDAALLRALFASGCRPAYVSAEAHTLEVVCVLHEGGGYRAFKLVEGDKVHVQYRQLSVTPADGSGARIVSFPLHSAGPFGDDVDGPWMTQEDLVRRLGMVDFGWRDVHATSLAQPDRSAFPRVENQLDRLLSGRDFCRYVCGRVLRSVKRRIGDDCG